MKLLVNYWLVSHEYLDIINFERKITI